MDRHIKKLKSNTWYRDIREKIAHLHRDGGYSECGLIIPQKARTLECHHSFPVDKKCKVCLSREKSISLRPKMQHD